jgi:hypothetical protein
MASSGSHNRLSQAPVSSIAHFSSVLEDDKPPMIPIIYNNTVEATGTFRGIKQDAIDPEYFGQAMTYECGGALPPLNETQQAVLLNVDVYG